MVISVFRKVDCDLTVIYNRFYFVFRINFIFIYIVFVQITTCSLFFVFVVYMIFHLLISFCRCIAQAHNANADKSTDKKANHKSYILTPSFSNFLLNTPTAESKKSSAVGIKSIVWDSSKFHTIRLSLFILNALRQGTHQTAIAFSSIGISPP